MQQRRKTINRSVWGALWLAVFAFAVAYQVKAQEECSNICNYSTGVARIIAGTQMCIEYEIGDCAPCSGIGTGNCLVQRPGAVHFAKCVESTVYKQKDRDMTPGCYTLCPLTKTGDAWSTKEAKDKFAESGMRNVCVIEVGGGS